MSSPPLDPVPSFSCIPQVAGTAASTDLYSFPPAPGEEPELSVDIPTTSAPPAQLTPLEGVEVVESDRPRRRSHSPYTWEQPGYEDEYRSHSPVHTPPSPAGLSPTASWSPFCFPALDEELDNVSVASGFSGMSGLSGISGISGISGLSDEPVGDGEEKPKKKKKKKRKAIGEDPVAPHAPGDVLVLVQFKWGRQGRYYHDTNIPEGTHLVVQADRGKDMGMVVECRKATDEEKADEMIQRVVRIATDDEVENWRHRVAAKEQTACRNAQRLLVDANLPMKIIHAEYQFDMKKLTFHFSANTAKPNFKPVLDKFFSLFRCRVWFSRYTNQELDERNRTILARQ